MDGGWEVVDVVRVIIVRLKFAARRADVMGVPKLPEACGFRGQYRFWRGGGVNIRLGLQRS